MAKETIAPLVAKVLLSLAIMNLECIFYVKILLDGQRRKNWPQCGESFVWDWSK